jgi:hypothetical protein
MTGHPALASGDRRHYRRRWPGAVVTGEERLDDAVRRAAGAERLSHARTIGDGGVTFHDRME